MYNYAYTNIIYISSEIFMRVCVWCVRAPKVHICTQLQIYMAESTLIYLLTCHHHLHILVYK